MINCRISRESVAVSDSFPIYPSFSASFSRGIELRAVRLYIFPGKLINYVSTPGAIDPGRRFDFIHLRSPHFVPIFYVSEISFSSFPFY